MSVEARGNDSVHVLPEILDLGGAETLKHGLVEILGGSEALVIEGGQVERVATPAIQVLLAVARDSTEKSRPFSLRNASAPLTAAFEDLGLAAELNKWSSS